MALDVSDDAPTAGPHSRSRPRRARGFTAELLRMQLHYPDPGIAVLRLSGEIDVTNTARLTELVQPRLRSQLQLLTLEMSQLEFLSVGGAQALAELASLARQHRTLLRITSPTRAVRRAFRTIGLETQLTVLEGPPEPEHGSTVSIESAQQLASELARNLARQGRTSNQ